MHPIIYLLVSLLIIGPISPAAAQTNDPNQLLQPSVDANRLVGTSFGSKEEKEAKTPPGIPQAPSGLFLPEAVGLTYQIHILGEVQKPGTYRVNASTRLSEAIEKAGGILERGSERLIAVRRSGGGSRSADLLSFKRFGNLDSNPYLLDNDVIFVPLKRKVIQIEGAVKRPGVYELKNERTLEQAIQLAGGLTAGFGDLIPIKVIRFSQGTKEVLDIENSKEARSRFILNNADAIILPHILTEKKTFDYNLARLPGDNPLFYPSYDERIFVIGAVGRPGPYPFGPYYNVRQYLTLAGGTTKLAKVKKIKIITSAGKTLKAKVDTEINPGDTIVVPEKYMAAESFATLVIGITASVVGITSAIVSLSR